MRWVKQFHQLVDHKWDDLSYDPDVEGQDPTYYDQGHVHHAGMTYIVKSLNCNNTGTTYLTHCKTVQGCSQINVNSQFTVFENCELRNIYINNWRNGAQISVFIGCYLSKCSFDPSLGLDTWIFVDSHVEQMTVNPSTPFDIAREEYGIFQKSVLSKPRVKGGGVPNFTLPRGFEDHEFAKHVIADVFQQPLAKPEAIDIWSVGL